MGGIKPSSIAVTKAAYPELDQGMVERTAEVYESIAEQSGSVVSEMAIASRMAEVKSQRGEDLAT